MICSVMRAAPIVGILPPLFFHHSTAFSGFPEAVEIFYGSRRNEIRG